MSSNKNKKQIVAQPQAASSAVTANKTVANVADDQSLVALKEETLRWIFSLIGAFLIFWIVASIILNVYHPDINAMVALANKIGFRGDSRPEPMETLLFRVGVITIISGVLLFYSLFSKMKLIKDLAQKPFFIFFSTACVLIVFGIIYLDFAANNPFAAGGSEQPMHSRDLVGKTNFSFFFDSLFLGDYLLVYTFLLVPLICFIFYFGIKKYNWESNKLFNNISSALCYIILGGTVLAVVLMNTYEFPYTFENKYDFSAVYYSMAQVFAGTPMLADGFSNTYGLYPHFLNPLFHIIGLSVFKFSLVMSILLGLAFLQNIYVLKQLVNNKLILLLGFLTVIFFPYFDNKVLTNFDSVFSFYPIRYIILSTLAFLAILYLNKRSQLLYWVTMVMMGFFVLWNPEIGLVSYLAWLTFNTYNDFYTPEGKVAYKLILMHWLCGIGSIIGVFMIFKFVYYICYGFSPDFTFLFSNIVMVGKAGFGLLPMVVVHPWNISALIIVLGFTYSIVKWYKKEITIQSSMILLISILSLGCLVYFQGRSHNWTFATSSGFSLLLLTILGSELWETIKDKGKSVLPLHVLFVIFLFVVSFSFFETLFNAKKITDLVYQEDDKEKQVDEQKRLSNNSDFILSHSSEKEKIYIFTASQYEGIYYNDSKRRAAMNPGLLEMALNSDLVKLENRIIDSSFSAFLEPALCNYPFLVRPLAALSATYDVKATDQAMFLLNKRKNKVPAKTFFGSNDDLVIHEKFTDDTAGTRLRINDALGIKPVALNPVFSVEVLFYSNVQAYPFATLVGNMDDTSGFIIANMINTPNYFFGINGKGVGVAIANNQWVYCVMNVYPDHLDIYQNGTLSGTFPIAGAMRQSHQKLSIGNLGYLRYYVGAISEVAIHNKELDKNQVEQTWGEIKQVLEK